MPMWSAIRPATSLRVGTGCRSILDNEQDRAVDRAARIVDQLLTSFSLSVPGGRYHAEMRKVRRADEAIEYSAWSQTLTVTPLGPPQPFHDGDVDRALALFDIVEADATAENAYVHLLTAWQLQDTAGAKPLQRSILQHYVLCMETIVNGLMDGIRKVRQNSPRGTRVRDAFF